ncbi:S9 family peptidase [Candidatus Palauibacter sp.]|uniref:S9 family peptidase n=1 Tax=Candidatus Palauibacter sp. TaxID=3101350 RepID=UPI003B01C693
MPRAKALCRDRFSLFAGLLAVSIQTAGCAADGGEPSPAPAGVTPPVARVIPEQLETHGHTRIDNYYWLNQRDNPEVIAYLEAENDYTDALMAHTEDFQAELFDEIKGRIKQTDLSVPVKEGDFFYYTRTEDGRDYPLYARKRGSLDADEEIILDVNALAEGHDFFAAFPEVSSTGDMMAWAEDTRGRRIYTIRIRNLDTGETYPEAIEGASGNMVWAEDNRTLFYTKRDPGTLRSYQIYRHRVGTDPADDVLVYQEDDEEFSSRVRKTKSKRYLVISSSHTLMDEHRFLDATDPEGEFTLFLPRERGHEHRIDHFGDHFYIRTNLDGAENFKLMRTPVGRTATDNWETVVPHRGDVFLQGFELFRNHLVLSERAGGLTRLSVRAWGGDEHQIAFDEPAYLASLSANPELDTDVLRFSYTSLSAPRALYDYDMSTRERTLLKEDEVLGGYDRTEYTVERLHAPARDGAVEIPVSLVYRSGLEKDGDNPLLLYAYGSYGSSMEPTFSSTRLSLIDRGFVYAIAHIRGGQELGRAWYEDGKMFNKKNTFTDYVDVADFLVAEGYTSPDKLFARGGSAGGLLMGAVVNMRPELFRGVIAHVPFVDVVTTMLDESIPLTSFEWDEWGDPRELESYRYMLSYSPYDQLEAKDYPNLLVTTGLHDSQVQYWEPAKWVAKLRATKTDENRLLLKTHMDAGHGGGSGRDRQYEELAFEFAFLLELLGDTASPR